MLIIGHRGAAGLAPANTLAALQAGLEAGADMLEIDVRLTKDHVPVVIHDARLLRTHRKLDSVSKLTFDELSELTRDQPLPTLQSVLDRYFGRILLNIELKSRGTHGPVIDLLESSYISKESDWGNILLSSFMGKELLAVRRRAPHAQLALLHSENPFIFVAYHRFLSLTAVGFHRLYLNRFAIEVARNAGLFIYAYTVNHPATLPLLEAQGVEGIVTNHPDKFISL